MKEILAIVLSFFSLFIKEPQTNIKGVILPHHELAQELFHTSFERLQKVVDPSTIVIYGTNHYYPEGMTFTTTTDIAEKYQIPNTLADDERIGKEHSIQTLVPYLTKYFSKSKIIPIIISSTYDLEDLKTKTAYLTNKLPQDTLYISSVDFSHNKTTSEGLLKNDESIKAISTFDYKTILDFKDDHIDSPVAITTLLLTMEKLNAKTWETWYTSHGGLLLNKPDLQGTSYVIGVFK